MKTEIAHYKALQTILLLCNYTVESERDEHGNETFKWQSSSATASGYESRESALDGAWSYIKTLKEDSPDNDVFIDGEDIVINAEPEAFQGFLGKLGELEPLLGDPNIEYADGADRELIEAGKFSRETLGIWASRIEPMDDHQKACLFCLLVKIGLTLDEALDVMANETRNQIENLEASLMENDKVSLVVFEGNLLEVAKGWLKLYFSQTASKHPINYVSVACMLQHHGALNEFEFGGKRWTYMYR